ncbi:MAG TPA: NUMOD4 domain-containing protein [Candidatus Omnitrophota bacterium]|nr:NUMOD4 domain-containing protein [Candidatus Omnitrophota bacterium]
MCNIEVWKSVNGFEGYYEISSHGRLKSYKKHSDGLILKQTNVKGGYYSVVLSANGKTRSMRIHRIVAETFLSNAGGLPEVNHIDGNKQNNHISNLEWCSRSHNARHSIKLHPKQCNHMNDFNKYIKPKSILMYDKRGNYIRWFINGADASRETGICHRNILQVCNGEKNEYGYTRKSAGGYIWRFESEVNNA